MLLRITLCFGLAVFVSGQIPIPKKQVGFLYKQDSYNAPVHFDAYLDLLCGDSKKAWPTILNVTKHYGPEKLKLTTHLFPLPYLRNGFYASKGAHVVDKESNGRLTYKWITEVFNEFKNLKISATHNQSDADVIDKLAAIADGIGIPAVTFKTGIQNNDMEWVARVEWKYACTRRVAATPTYMLNDVVVPATQDWTVDQWKAKIDPLLEDTVVTSPEPTSEPTAEPTSRSMTLCPAQWTISFVILAAVVTYLTTA